MLYVTDRRPILKEIEEAEEQSDGQENEDAENDENVPQETVGYDWGRSPSLAFGSAIVTIGDDVPWDTLVAESRTNDRTISLPVVVSEVEEKGRFPDTPMPGVRNEYGGFSPDPEVVKVHQQVVAEFHDELRARLAHAQKKHVYIYIHGYNNSFDDAVMVIGEMWHFLGRQGVPIAYTWPAGVGGLRGYFYDRESGEYTIYHLKQFFRALLACEEVEGIHFIAHSRGTDVLVTALRELFIELREQVLAQGVDGKRTAGKIKNIVLAAPDLDFEVISQRLIAERFMSYVNRFTIYMSTTDVALGLSTWLFLSQRRVGRVQFSDLPPVYQREARKATHVTLVDARVSSGLIGHSYFYSHPAVLSDLILVLRDGRPPGMEHGRPLEHIDVISWRIEDDYPNLNEKPASDPNSGFDTGSGEGEPKAAAFTDR